MTDRSALGSKNRRKGHAAEVALANWLARNGWPEARRAVTTGHYVRNVEIEDPGDIRGTPALVWSVKNYAADTIERHVPGWLDELDAMVGIGDQLGGLPLLVVKRAGKADPGDWWVFLRLAHLHGCDCECAKSRAAIRMRLADLVALLHDAGYGEKK